MKRYFICSKCGCVDDAGNIDGATRYNSHLCYEYNYDRDRVKRLANIDEIEIALCSANRSITPDDHLEGCLIKDSSMEYGYSMDPIFKALKADMYKHITGALYHNDCKEVDELTKLLNSHDYTKYHPLYMVWREDPDNFQLPNLDNIKLNDQHSVHMVILDSQIDITKTKSPVCINIAIQHGIGGLSLSNIKSMTDNKIAKQHIPMIPINNKYRTQEDQDRIMEAASIKRTIKSLSKQYPSNKTMPDRIIEEISKLKDRLKELSL